MMTELQPCPFCGGAAEANEFAGTKLKPAVTCVQCGADVTAKTLELAVEAWNRRVAPANYPDPADRHGGREAVEEFKAWMRRKASEEGDLEVGAGFELCTAPASPESGPLNTVVDWYKALPPRARAGLSLENLHTLSKALRDRTASPTER